ncbi:GlcG/HbpS family heme-binding protein [Shumkonia mesophila]|uniref:GlcG/HbpS family heme-binding protein n=1 Tax=Shumkonia mesophila TaxID=2838854 RepID=UPI00293472ED|nr:heme-binding protein [Shumkonia mesophila]
MRNGRMGVAAVGFFAVLGTAAWAEDGPLVSVNLMKPEMAVKLAQAALDGCRAEGAQVTVAVVDRFGVLQALIRDRFAGPHTPDAARRKAYTAASFRSDTLTLSEAARAGGEAYGANFIAEALMLGGGVPVEAGGAMLGAVGVSGAPSGAMDDRCARMGIDAIAMDLEL